MRIVEKPLIEGAQVAITPDDAHTPLGPNIELPYGEIQHPHVIPGYVQSGSGHSLQQLRVEPGIASWASRVAPLKT